MRQYSGKENSGDKRVQRRKRGKGGGETVKKRTGGRKHVCKGHREPSTLPS